MRGLTLLAALLMLSCGPISKPKPHIVCTTNVNSDCEDACVANTAKNVDECRDKCVSEVCP